MLFICLIPIIGPAIVFVLTGKELISIKKWNSGHGITVLFGFLYSTSWVIAAFLALSCEVMFDLSDERFFTFIMLGFSCILSPWPAWGYHIRVEKLIGIQNISKEITEEEKSKFI